MMNDPYKVLGLNRNATKEEAKAKFRTLAKECHPDLHPNDKNAEKRFKEINEAYDSIKSDGKTNDQPFGFNFDDPYEMFSFMMNHGRRNSDLHLEHRITLEEAFHGKTLHVQIPNRSGHDRTITVNIPPGIRNGMRMSVPNGGNTHNPTFTPGDLYVTIMILPHNRFVIDQKNNLVTTIPVSVFDVLIGKTIEFINIDGQTLTVNIPENFDSSRKLRLAGQGMPNYHGPRGDLLIDLLITYPKLSEEQMDLIKQIVALSD